MRKIRLALTLLLILSLLVGSVFASGRASDLIADYSNNIIINSSGDLLVSFSITTVGNATRLGASTIVIEKKVFGVWRAVETYDFASTPNLRRTNASFHGTSVTYEDYVSGYDYRACITYYATNGSITETREVYTATIS